MSSIFGPPVFGIPVNQLNAIPIITTSQYKDGQGAQALIIGGATVKFWSPTVLGVLNQVPNCYPGPAPTGKWYLATNWLDLSPCLHFTMLVKRTLSLAPTSKSAWVQAQYRFDDTDLVTPTFWTGGAMYDDIASVYNMHITGKSWTVFPGPGGVDRFAVGFGPCIPAAVGMQATPVMSARDMRFQLSWGTNDPTNGYLDMSTYSMALWGHS